MFSITFMVDDKHLARVMNALDGVYNLEIKPVRNAVANGGKVSARHPGGSLAARVAAILTERKIKTITLPELKAIAIEAGGSVNHAKNMGFQMVRDKVLRRTGKGSFAVK